MHRVAVALLLSIMAALAGGSAFRESVTIEEVAHMGAGVSYLQKLDLRMNEEHPPLAKVIAAIPLVFRGAHADYTHLSWTFSEKILNQFLGEWVFGHWFLMRWNDPQSTLLWAGCRCFCSRCCWGSRFTSSDRAWAEDGEVCCA